MKTQGRLRMTPQRRVMLQILGESRSHPTADELYERVRQKLPRVSLGTVYRNLELLSSRGVIRKIEIGGAQKRFDADMSDHCHVRCVRCGRIDDLPGGYLRGLREVVTALARRHWPGRRGADIVKGEGGGFGEVEGEEGDLLEGEDADSHAGGDYEYLAHISNYEIIGHRMEFMGICPQCKGGGKTLGA